MNYVDYQSIDSSLSIDRKKINSISRTSMKKTNTHENMKWRRQTSLFNASLRRFQSPFRRDTINTSSSTSYPLFRHFYLMRSSFRHRRARISQDSTITNDSFISENFHSTLRIELRHVLFTLSITIVSAFLLILMIYLDFIYLNDIISNIIQNEIMMEQISLCTQYPKICIIKSIVVIVFISITLLLCYTILTLYTRARRHTRSLELKTVELEKEKCLTQKLLHQILPPCVAKDLINGRQAPAEYYDSVTVYFSDIVGFTHIASMCSANETCDMLNQLYSIFDSLLENFDVYKVETIGDAYMVVSGAPERNDDRVSLCI
ncbi:hypothetical protein I4U23_026602 [Adineta vaga]|nr:hypothetical protein I4U23_026602 [Adineta vaga]